jgi:outer membrane protein assembly factor BamB
VSQDFVTRLQLQLRDAAEREERRGLAGRAAHRARHDVPWRPALALAALAVAAILVVGAASTLHRHRTPANHGLRVVSHKPLVSEGGPLIAGFGSIWAVDSATGQVLRLDPHTHAVRARITLGGDLAPQLEVADGAVWACDGARLLRIDPATNAIVARVPLGTPARTFVGVIAGPGVVWVVSPTEMLRFDPSRNVFDGKVTLSRGGFEANGFGGDGRTLYFTRADGSLAAFDARTGARLESRSVPLNGVSVAASRGKVFLATEKSVGALDVRTGRTLWNEPLRVQRINGVVLGGSTLWVEGADLTDGGDRVWRIDAASGRVTGTLALSDLGAGGMAPVGRGLWLVSSAGVLQIIQ